MDTLNDAQKKQLADLHRQLLEPAASLKEVKTEDLVLPKVVNVEEERELKLPLQKHKQIVSNDTKLVSVGEFLKGQTAPGNTTASPKNLCVHQEKTVVECSVDFKLLPTEAIDGTPETTESTVKPLPSFTPGDAFGIYSSNVLADVHTILTRTFVYDGDQTRKILNSSSTTPWNYLATTLNTTSERKEAYIKLSDKKSIVKLLPHLFYGVDLRTIAKKAFLAHLAQFTTSNEAQQRRLLELSSRQGAADYQALVFAHRLTLMDILRTFTACRPPLSLLLYYLMSAKPRYFSAASLPKLLVSGDPKDKEKENLAQFKILLSVTTDYTHSFGRSSSAQVLGLFSGKFFQHFPTNAVETSSFFSIFPSDLACTDVWKSLEAVNAPTSTAENRSPVFDVPLLPVNSPSSSFPVRHRHCSFSQFARTSTAQQQMEQSNKTVPGKLYLFFGSRHPFQDCTYARQLIELSKKTTNKEDEQETPVISHLCLCFSRASSQVVAQFERQFDWKLCKCKEEESEIENSDALPKHVDQLVTAHGAELVELITQQDAHVYICGDWKKLGPSLAKTFSRLFSEHYLAETEPSASSPEATKYLKELQKSGRYAVDIWS
ncbi:hypothetical protein TYRP_009802 [Tyrophagus putrescentiae]|nr:hypothetical protein TYRP_009802 [Tyrophagus putrescentiae]